MKSSSSAEPPSEALSDEEDDDAEAGDQSARLEEGVPLLPKSKAPQPQKSQGIRETLSTRFANVREQYEAQPEKFEKSHNDKLLCYDQDSLLTADALLLLGKSAFAQAPVLITLAYCAFLASAAALAVFLTPKASKFDTTRFDNFGNFLKFFIVFMLGIYVAQAFKRWWYTVTTFEKFLIAIRQMVFMLHTLKYTPQLRRTIETYCVASGYILNVEVRNAQLVDKNSHIDVHALLRWLSKQSFLSPDEVAQLDRSSGNNLGRTRAIWSWISELVSHPVVEPGHVVLPPLLARTIILCQGCIAEIENLKMNITMQTPFLYAQLLAILVHVNNTILSLSCGMAIGSAMNEIRRRSEQLAGERDTDHRDVTIVEQLYGAIQTCGVQLMIVLITPMLYVAFLHIAHILCYPFGDESYHLPTETLIARLHSELRQMTDNRVYFRQKHLEWKQQQQLK
jgi:hypothetical protein